MPGPKRLLLTLLLPAVILAVFAAGALAAPAGKVDICHFASHKFVEISVSENALQAHLNHGDVMTDVYGECP